MLTPLHMQPTLPASHIVLSWIL